MSQISADVKQTMSSLEIAELTGKDHAKVIGDIKRVLNEVEIDHAVFGSIFLDSYKREQPCFNLPRRECDLIIAGYSAKYRLAIIDRWQELEEEVKELPPVEKQFNSFEFVTTSRHMLALAKTFGYTDDQEARVVADRAIKTITGISPMELLGMLTEMEPKRNGLVLVQPTLTVADSKLVVARDIAKQFGLTSQSLNLLLNKAGLLKGYPGSWGLTTEGAKFGRYCEYTGTKSTYSQIRWYETVADYLVEKGFATRTALAA